jgi:uncharacterized membrane protein
MSDSDKGVLTLLIGGILYGILKLGDEFILVFGDILRVFEESFLLRRGIVGIGEKVAEMNLSIESIVLGLLAIFLVLAIVDYVSTEL